eukprot:m.66837 g.66837  ORF g.66837 m.66837 type:complete len:63 (-) comp12144_c1_seq4:1353-1541(-)
MSTRRPWQCIKAYDEPCDVDFIMNVQCISISMCANASHDGYLSIWLYRDDDADADNLCRALD